MTRLAVAVPLPDDWQVLDLDPEQRSRGALVAALLAGRDDDGVLAASLDVVVTPLGRAGPPTRTAADGVAVVLARAVSPYRSVTRLDLPSGPAVGLQDVLRHPDGGQVGIAQVWLPLADARALVLTLSTPCLDQHDGLTRLLSAVAHGLVVDLRDEAAGV
ncbi:MAG: hypothetical protein M3P95_13745 [Actinomycetota bacterium]|nr:hypothetical protein [Actinomycetota bacterium]